MTIKKNLISVIIPCFNAGVVLKRAIESVLNQTHKETEIILINDGSTDIKTIEILNNYKKKFKKKFLLVNQKNKGLSYSRNKGISLANGNYIFFLDADDYLEQDCLKILKRKLGEKKTFALSNFYLINDENSKKKIVYNFFELLFANQLSYSGLYNAKIFRKFGNYDVEMRDGFEDWELHIRLGKNNIFPIIVDQYLFNYSVSSLGMLKSRSLKKYYHIVNYIRNKHFELYNIKKLLIIYKKWKEKKSKYFLFLFFFFNFIIKNNFFGRDYVNINLRIAVFLNKFFRFVNPINKTQKILHVINSLDVGGAEKSLYNLIISSRFKYKHEVLFLKEDGYYKKKLIDNGIKVYAIDFTKQLFLVPNILKFFFTILKSKPSIIQSNLYHSDFLCSLYFLIFPLSRIKLIWVLHNNNLTSPSINYLTKLITFFNAFFSYLIPSKIVSVSKSGMLTHSNNGYFKKKITVINPFFEKNFINLNTHSNSLRVPKKERKTIYFGSLSRWHYQKNHPLLLKAFSILKKNSFKFKLLLAGREMNKSNPALASLLKGSNLVIGKDVLLLDEILNIKFFFNKIDFLVSTSLSESFPLALVEAQINNIPCISSNVGDAKYIIKKAGWVFMNGDLNDFLKKIIQTKEIFQNKKKLNHIKNLGYKNSLKIMLNFTQLSKQYKLWEKYL